jgi:hypothetical protein
MFLCEPCHKAGGCTRKFGEMRSRGRCECCGEGATCRDCHGYDFRRSPEHTHRPTPTTDPPIQSTEADK